jgi:hypothetical protein
MQLISTWPSKLSEFHYEELLQLLQKAISEGDYGAGTLFSQASIQALLAQAQDFQSLPRISAGDRATVDSLQYPLDLIQARYASLQKETDNFLAQMRVYLDVVSKDSGLVEELLVAAGLNSWAATKPQLPGAQKKSWDYATSHGLVETSLPYQDPGTGLIYRSSIANVSDVSLNLESLGGSFATGSLQQGIGVPATVTTIPVTNLTWTFTATDGQAPESEALYGADWAKLTFLADKPSLVYGDPSVSMVSPQVYDPGTNWSNFFSITGTSTSGNLPVYLRVIFTPRRQNVVMTFTGQPQKITDNRLILDDFIVYNNSFSYQQDIDYLIDNDGNIIASGALVNQTASIMFTEGFPSYQCSINRADWSPIIMLDPNRPAPDGSIDFLPVSVKDGNEFPILDESGTPLGLYISQLRVPPTEYLLQIESPVADNYGMTAKLEVSFDRPLYMNGLNVDILSSYGLHLKGISADGLESQKGIPIFTGDFLLDRAQTIHFPRQLINKLYLDLVQVNYTYKTHSPDPAGDLKRNALASLQAVLPFSLQEVNIATPRQVSGCQYEFSLGSISGQDSIPNTLYGQPGMFIAGPLKVTGTPDLIRFDIDAFDPGGTSVKAYLIAQEFAVDGTISSVTQISSTPGTAFVYSKITSGAVSYVNFYIKAVMFNELSVLKRYLLQVTNV